MTTPENPDSPSTHENDSGQGWPPPEPCPICRGTGCASTYWGEIVHPMYGTLKVDGEHHLDLPPGGRFYGGSGHGQCQCRRRLTHA